MSFEKYFLVLSNVNANRALYLIMEDELSIIEVEVLLKVKHEEAKASVLALKEAGIILENTGKSEVNVHFKMADKFVQENKLLYDYLRHEYKKDELFQKDLRRLRIFKGKDITIEEVIADREGVIKQLDRK